MTVLMIRWSMTVVGGCLGCWLIAFVLESTVDIVSYFQDHAPDEIRRAVWQLGMPYILIMAAIEAWEPSEFRMRNAWRLPLAAVTMILAGIMVAGVLAMIAKLPFLQDSQVAGELPITRQCFVLGMKVGILGCAAGVAIHRIRVVRRTANTVCCRAN